MTRREYFSQMSAAVPWLEHERGKLINDNATCRQWSNRRQHATALASAPSRKGVKYRTARLTLVGVEHIADWQFSWRVVGQGTFILRSMWQLNRCLHETGTMSWSLSTNP